MKSIDKNTPSTGNHLHSSENMLCHWTKMDIGRLDIHQLYHHYFYCSHMGAVSCWCCVSPTPQRWFLYSYARHRINSLRFSCWTCIQFNSDYVARINDINSMNSLRNRWWWYCCSACFVHQTRLDSCCDCRQPRVSPNTRISIIDNVDV